MKEAKRNAKKNTKKADIKLFQNLITLLVLKNEKFFDKLGDF